MGSLELERGKALEHLFRHPDIKQSMQIISKTLYEVMELDKTCMELTEQARQVMLKQLNHQSQGERALNVYRENAP
jgi:flagellar biosynthesis component FlhA